MQTIDLTGSPVQGAMIESYLKIEGGVLDAVILPNTEINVGDNVFWKLDREKKPILKTVKNIIERRKSKGDFSRTPVHKDWIRLEFE